MRPRSDYRTIGEALSSWPSRELHLAEDLSLLCLELFFGK